MNGGPQNAEMGRSFDHSWNSLAYLSKAEITGYQAVFSAEFQSLIKTQYHLLW